MRIYLFWVFLLPALVHGNFEQFASNNDPGVVHHVNVITGDLQFSFQDIVSEGAVSIPLTRSYSSSGALFPIATELYLKAIRKGWLVQGGWNLLSHTNLLLIPAPKRKGYSAHLAEPGGGVISYEYSHKDEKHLVFLKPTQTASQASGKLSAHTNSKHNLLRIDLKLGEAVLFLPDGGKRIYRGRPLNKYKGDDSAGKFFYLLDVEILPSQHRFHYFYDGNTNLQKIEARNPKGTKVYSSMDFSYTPGDTQNLSKLSVVSSDHKEMHYFAGTYRARECIHEVDSNCKPYERSHLACERKWIGPRIIAVNIGGQNRFEVSYYESTQKQMDKVSVIRGPFGSNGEMVDIAKFSYGEGYTDVEDATGIHTTYRHDGKNINQIFYYDKNNQFQLLRIFAIYLKSKEQKIEQIFGRAEE